MTQAQRIIDSVRCVREHYSVIIREANDAAVSVDQDWDNETTTYVFNDGSELVDCNGHLTLA